jgi:hypothetical protein
MSSRRLSLSFLRTFIFSYFYRIYFQSLTHLTFVHPSHSSMLPYTFFYLTNRITSCETNYPRKPHLFLSNFTNSLSTRLYPHFITNKISYQSRIVHCIETVSLNLVLKCHETEDLHCNWPFGPLCRKSFRLACLVTRRSLLEDVCAVYARFLCDTMQKRKDESVLRITEVRDCPMAMYGRAGPHSHTYRPRATHGSCLGDPGSDVTSHTDLLRVFLSPQKHSGT